MGHVHYKTDHLKLAKKIAMLKDTYSLRTHFHVDVLDCNVSWARQPVDMSFEEIMEKFDDSCFFTVIHRRPPIGKGYLEIAFSTMGVEPSYFLWLHMDEKFVHQVVRTCDLVPAL